MRGGTHKYGLGFKNAYSEREEREYETPLIEAVKAEDCTTTVLLLERGADIEGHSEDRTALTVAAARGCLKIVQVLIEHRADVNVLNCFWNQWGVSALESKKNAQERMVC
ncbi:hypothetical protein BDD12DRAFT_396096 [Trichophaea hybrida]|nr:hypothetical protein BDD12DRAFT_396096 [Trichophaea hybrida]